MPLEPANHISELVPTNPTPGDPKSQGDDHLRNLKTSLLNDLAGFDGAIMCTGVDGGAANAYTVAPARAIAGYGRRMTVVFGVTVANTGASTMKISALEGKPLKSVNGLDLVQGDLTPGVIYAACYNGTEFRLLSITKNYADQLAFSSVLPAQANNKGKFLRTNGTTAYWDFPGITTVAPVATTDVILVDPYVFVPVQMASIGKSITLPNATLLTTGGPLYVIDNTKGGFTVGIRDNTGALVMAVAAGGVAMVLLRGNSAAAGDWLVTGSGLEPGSITADQTFSSTYATTAYPVHVVMDANTSIHFLGLSAGGYAAFVVDNLGKVISTPVVIDSTAGQAPVLAFKIDATRIIVFTSNRAVVILLDGASPNYSLSRGNIGTVSHGSTYTGMPKICQLAPTSYVLMNVNGLQTTALSINGTVITTGATSTVPGDSGGDPSIYPLTATTALVLYSTNTGTTLKAYVVSVSGTTITPGTVATGASTVLASTCMLSANKIIVTGAFGSTGVASVVTVSGTTASFGPTFTISTNTPRLGIDEDGASRYNPRLYPVASDKVLLWYRNASGSTAWVLTESSGTLTGGPILSGTFNTGFVATGSTTDFVAVLKSASNNFTLVPHRIVGDVVTAGVAQSLPEIPPEVATFSTPSIRTSQGDYLVFAAGISALPVFRLSGESAIKRGAISTPTVGGPSAYPPMVISPRRLILIASSGLQIRLLNFEVAV